MYAGSKKEGNKRHATNINIRSNDIMGDAQDEHIQIKKSLNKKKMKQLRKVQNSSILSADELNQASEDITCNTR